MNRNKLQVRKICSTKKSSHKKKEREGGNAITTLVRKSKIVKFIYECKVLMSEEYTMAMTTYNTITDYIDYRRKYMKIRKVTV